jgi:hypothetical protein
MRGRLRYRWDRGSWLLWAGMVALQVACATGAWILGRAATGRGLSGIGVYLAIVIAGNLAIGLWLLWLHGPWRGPWRPR